MDSNQISLIINALRQRQLIHNFASPDALEKGTLILDPGYLIRVGGIPSSEFDLCALAANTIERLHSDIQRYAKMNGIVLAAENLLTALRLEEEEAKKIEPKAGYSKMTNNAIVELRKTLDAR